MNKNVDGNEIIHVVVHVEKMERYMMKAMTSN